MDFVNNIPLRPTSVKVSVDTMIRGDAFLWRPAQNMYTIAQAVGETIAWPQNCVVSLAEELDLEDIPPKKSTKLLEDSNAQNYLLTSPIFLPKLEDQGKFTLPCKLGHLELDNALVDSGTSINLISLTMAQKLSIHQALQRPTTSIMFGDATSKSPLGVFKNYPLKVGECIIQTDLTVLKMEEERDVPLILGTPFLSTMGASIDFHNQEVILHKVNSLVSYRLQPQSFEYCGTIGTTPLSSKSHGLPQL
ncbi:unnamed protein product [Microthlaspi erraticum]|uniref:Uncharacterized protein n=1 Tax=Microthlaspi erraticum TaxID=1685480 RepID=A0A6D2KLM9_9BRAS|nr:unnamed protein product [Microthlaspi erraticum]